MESPELFRAHDSGFDVPEEGSNNTGQIVAIVVVVFLLIVLLSGAGVMSYRKVQSCRQRAASALFAQEEEAAAPPVSVGATGGAGAAAAAANDGRSPSPLERAAIAKKHLDARLSNVEKVRTAVAKCIRQTNSVDCVQHGTVDGVGQFCKVEGDACTMDTTAITAAGMNANAIRNMAIEYNAKQSMEALHAAQTQAGVITGIQGKCGPNSTTNMGGPCTAVNSASRCGAVGRCDYQIPQDTEFEERSKCKQGSTYLADHKQACLYEYAMYLGWKGPAPHTQSYSVEQISNTLASMGLENEPFVTKYASADTMKCTPSGDCTDANGNPTPFKPGCTCTNQGDRLPNASYPAMCSRVDAVTTAMDFPQYMSMNVDSYPLDQVYGLVRASLIADNLPTSRHELLNQSGAEDGRLESRDLVFGEKATVA